MPCLEHPTITDFPFACGPGGREIPSDCLPLGHSQDQEVMYNHPLWTLSFHLHL